VLCLPGSVFEMPGYFRISLTANDEMIERALPGFERAMLSVGEAQWVIPDPIPSQQTDAG
jgi:hypothetical protein